MAYSRPDITDGYFLTAVNDRIRSDIKRKITEKVMESVRDDIVGIIEEAMKDIETRVMAERSFADFTDRFVIRVDDIRRVKEPE